MCTVLQYIREVRRSRLPRPCEDARRCLQHLTTFESVYVGVPDKPLASATSVTQRIVDVSSLVFNPVPGTLFLFFAEQCTKSPHRADNICARLLNPPSRSPHYSTWIIASLRERKAHSVEVYWNLAHSGRRRSQESANTNMTTSYR